MPDPATHLRRPADDAARRPPFPVIVGCPRSGTSLLAVMLDAHPELAMPPETAFVKHVVRLHGESADLAQRFVEIVTTDRAPISNWSDFGLAAADLRARVAAIEPFTVPAGMRAFFDLYAAAQGKSRAGEKTPDDTFLMREIGAMLPEARFIHVIRDPRDTVLSWQKTWFAPSRDPAVLGAGWRHHVESGRHGGSVVAHYVETRYEDLVRAPQRELRRLCEYLDLEYSPAMEDPSAQGAARIARLNGRMHTSGRMISREDRTTIHRNLAQPPIAARVDVWRREMGSADRKAVERAASPLMQQLGYAVQGE
jgi:hypothetical protein